MIATRRTFLTNWASFGACAALLALRPTPARADVPPDLLRLVTDATEALSNGEASNFLDKFDRNMPGYADLRERIEGLVAAYEVGSTIEIANDSGDETSHSIELDWLLILNDRNDLNGRKESRRQIIKCQAKREGKRWKITSLEPIDFFRY